MTGTLKDNRNKLLLLLYIVLYFIITRDYVADTDNSDCTVINVMAVSAQTTTLPVVFPLAPL